MYKTFIILGVYFFILLISTSAVFAQDEVPQPVNNITSIESLLDSFNIDLPSAKTFCTTGGYLSKYFPETANVELESSGNTLFIDQNNKSIGVFQKAAIDTFAGRTEIEMFIRLPNISRQSIADFLIFKRRQIIKSADIIFVIKRTISEKKSVYVYSSSGVSAEISNVKLKLKLLQKLSNIIFNGEQFLAANIKIKIQLPEPPKLIGEDGQLIDILEKLPGYINCVCEDCPLHDFDLSELQNTFDGELVNSIIEEAIK